MIVAGVGCRRGAAAQDVEAALRAALAHAGVTAEDLNAIATGEAKQGEGGIETVAAKLGVRLMLIPDDELRAAGKRATTRSDRVLALMGLPSLAEAAALAAAGPSAQLIVSRLIVGAATCALAATDATQ
ncbi:MAG TPA: cobalamin biosynthesis protein [Xanthobacteraceae bacterium]|nr:cobalamin biosynthesis protein [Xanthobacteraceae bacterium]